MNDVILSGSDTYYGDLKKVGRVVIEHDGSGVQITVDGFEFGDLQTCRIHCAKALAWATDIMANAAEANRLIPGGAVSICRGVDQDALDAQR